MKKILLFLLMTAAIGSFAQGTFGGLAADTLLATDTLISPIYEVPMYPTTFSLYGSTDSISGDPGYTVYIDHSMDGVTFFPVSETTHAGARDFFLQLPTTFGPGLITRYYRIRYITNATTQKIQVNTNYFKWHNW